MIYRPAYSITKDLPVTSALYYHNKLGARGEAQTHHCSKERRFYRAVDVHPFNPLQNFMVHGEGLEPPYPRREDALQAPAIAALPTMHTSKCCYQPHISFAG